MGDGNISEDHRHIKSICFDNFVEENKDFRSWLKSKRFNIWIQKYCQFHGKQYKEGNSQGQRWFEITTQKKVVSTDIWDSPELQGL